MISWLQYQLGGKAPGKIGIRLITASILFSSLLALGITVSQFFQAYERELSRIDQNVQLIEKVYLDSLSKVIWLMDEELILAQLNSILSFPEVEEVSLLDDINNKRAVGENFSSKNHVHSFELILINQGERQHVGQLKLTIGLNEVYKDLFKETLIIFAANIAKAWLVAIIMLLLFKRMVTRHLESMSNWISHFDVTNTDADLTLPGDPVEKSIPPQGNEIIELYTGINNLGQSLIKSWNNLDNEYKQQGVKLEEALSLMHKESEEREQTQAMLQKSNAKLNANNYKLDHMIKVVNRHVMSIQVNHVGIISDVSDAFCSAFSYAKSECINHPLIRIIKSDLDSELTILFHEKKDHFEVYEKKEIWIHITVLQNTMDEDSSKITYQVFLDDITSQKRAEALSTTDALTNLKNRRSFDHLFNALLIEAREHNKILLLSLIDIDHFKEYNDNYGHQEGDNCLIAVAKALSDGMRSFSDHAFRVGGEEFAILCFISSVNDAPHIIEKLRSGVEGLKINHEENTASEYVTASFGAVLITDQKDDSLDDLYSAADKALYEAKNNGRNKIVIKN